jgi:hypothetical protein
MDNVIFLIIIIMYCVYMSAQNKWPSLFSVVVVVESLGPLCPNKTIYGCLKKISDSSYITTHSYSLYNEQSDPDSLGLQVVIITIRYNGEGQLRPPSHGNRSCH